MENPPHTWLHIEMVHHLHLTRLVTLHIHEPIQLMFDDWEKIQSKSMDAWINGLMHCNGRKKFTHTPPSSRTFASDMAIKHTRRPWQWVPRWSCPPAAQPATSSASQGSGGAGATRLPRAAWSPFLKFNTTTKGTWLEIAIEHLAAAEMTKTFKNTNLAVHYSGKYSVYNGENGQGKRIGND